MSPHSLKQSLRQFWALEKFSYSVRVFIALSGVLALCWSQSMMAALTPMLLGIIASALAETDDNWQGRLTALLVSLVCFCTAAFTVELLFPYPLLLGVALVVSTFALILLGALGERYASTGWATLILSIYSMIVVEQRGHSDFDPKSLLMVAGAAWYGLLSVLWQALFANQPVQHSLARLFHELGHYLQLKAALFEPVRKLDINERRLALAKQNGQVVAALNSTKELIVHRVGNGRPGPKVNCYLKLYFLAQDLHERASSSHNPYHELTEAFFHSDVMFRCQRLLRLQGEACQRLAKAIKLRQPYALRPLCGQALEDLNSSLEHLRLQSNPAWRHLLRSLRALANNLSTLNRLLSNAHNPDSLADEQDSSLFDREPRSLKDIRERLRQHLTPTSLLFRHALRLSIALAVGYGLLHWVHPSHGYWILLTTVFVCQPSYGATRRKLGQRVSGTALGLILGWALFDLFPNLQVQALLVIAAGVVFFTLRRSHYTTATAAITLLVLFCFNQVGDGHMLIVPRLVDTLIGGLIAGLAVLLILPDWQGRQLHRLVANALSCNNHYLRQIIEQYAQGKRDDLAYRLARRNAHNADAALSTTLANMLKEPGHFRKQADLGFRCLLLSHTLLSYLSGLGAHRGETLLGDDQRPLLESAQRLVASLDEIAQALASKQPLAVQSDAEEQLAAELGQLPEEASEQSRFIQTQLALICGQLGPLRTLCAYLINGEKPRGLLDSDL